MNLTTERKRIVFRRAGVEMMAEGENGKFYVKLDGETKILELDLVSSTFTEQKSIDIGIKDIDDLHYVLSPHRLALVSNIKSKLVRAVSVDTGKTIWDFSQKVDCKEVEPEGVLFLPEHDVILVGDTERIHFLRAPDGKLLQTVYQPDLDRVCQFYLCKDKIATISALVYVHEDDKENVILRTSYFAINLKFEHVRDIQKQDSQVYPVDES